MPEQAGVDAYVLLHSHVDFVVGAIARIEQTQSAQYQNAPRGTHSSLFARTEFFREGHRRMRAWLASR